MEDSLFKINPSHDFEAYGATLQSTGRLQIRDFLVPESAEYLYEIHIGNREWNLTYNEGDNHYESPARDLQGMSAIQKQQFMANIYNRARTQFQYVFYQYYITQAVELNEQPGHPLHKVHEFVNSDYFLDRMRKLVGDDTVAKADSYASNYAPGHFLTAHDDRHERHQRVAAYTIGMTREWNKNWGGYLSFYDDTDNVIEAFAPSFNTLNLFLVPQTHAVQLVSPFAGANRISYLGWLQR